MLKKLLILSICLAGFISTGFADNLDLLNQQPTNNLLTQTNNNQQTPLDEALKLSVTFQNDQELVAHWEIMPEFMLYQNRIHIEAAPKSSARIGDALIPPNDTIKKIFIDGKPVFEGFANAFIPVTHLGDGNLELLISYQGCKGRLYCYPPRTKLVTVNLKTKIINIENAPEEMITPIESSLAKGDLYKERSLLVIILSFFGLGILLSFTPCILPMLPILWGIIVGKDHSTKHALFLASAYILSMSVTFAILGVIAAFAGHTLQAALQNIWVILFFCLILIVLAASLFDLYEFQLPRFLQSGVNNINQEQKPGTLSGAIIMGALSTVVVSPCVSAPLIAALLYIAKTGNIIIGGSSLFALALGMGLPLLVICVAGHKFLPKSGTWMVSIKRIFGFVVIGLAIWLLSRFISGPLTLLLYAILLISAATYLGVLTVRSQHRWPRIKRVIAILLFAYGIVLALGALEGHTNPLRPFSKEHTNHLFQSVTDMKSLNQMLAKAKEEHRPVIIDFYADWCVACKEMDSQAFSDPDVIKSMKPFMRLRVDLTKNDSASLAIAKRYHVFAPPSIVFYDENGKELISIQVFGETDKNSLLKYIESIIKKQS